MRRNFINRLWQRAVAPPALRGWAGLRLEAEHVDGSCARPEAAQAVAHRFGGDAARHPRSLEGVVAEREPRGEDRRMRAARAMRSSAGMPLAGYPLEPGAVEEDVRPIGPVAAGHHDDPGTKGVDRTGEVLDV